jgi:hypothetical protein
MQAYREKLSEFFSGFDDCLLGDLDLPTEILDFCSFTTLSLCLQDPNFPNKKEVCELLRHMESSSVWEELSEIYYMEYCSDRFGDYNEEILTTKAVIDLIENECKN